LPAVCTMADFRFPKIELVVKAAVLWIVNFGYRTWSRRYVSFWK
jgi:hypothetical protein